MYVFYINIKTAILFKDNFNVGKQGWSLFKIVLKKPQKYRGLSFRNLNYTVKHILYVLTFIAFYKNCNLYSELNAR